MTTDHSAHRPAYSYTIAASVLVSLAGLSAITSPTDPDLFWHLKNGQLMLTNGFDPADVFSFSEHGRPWVAHEWLFDITAFFLMRVSGYRALVFVAGAVQAITTQIFIRTCRARGVGQLLTLVLTGVFFVCIGPTWGVRAQMVTAPLVGFFYVTLLRYCRKSSDARPPWMLVPIMLIWANLHASFPLGLAVIALFILGRAVNRFVYNEPSGSAANLTRVFVVCTLATLINPHGIGLWTYPLPFAFSEDPIVRYIAEWRATNFHNPLNLVFAASLLMLAIVGLGEPAAPASGGFARLQLRRRFNVTDVSLVVVFATLALRYTRFQALYGIVVLPLIGQAVTGALSLAPTSSDTPRAVTTGIERVVTLLLVAGLATLSFMSPNRQMGLSPRSEGYPAGAVQLLEAAPGARVFNEYAWGGYLLYSLYPSASVFIDGRADLYRDGAFRDYAAVTDVTPVFATTLDRIGANFVLIRPGAPLATALRLSTSWNIAFEDSVSVLFRRAEKKAE